MIPCCEGHRVPYSRGSAMATTSSTLWNAVVLRIGKGAQDMLDTGVIVLFGEPVPDALSDICVVHNRGGRSPLTPQRELLPGDVLNFAGTRYTIDEVGRSRNLKSQRSRPRRVVFQFPRPISTCWSYQGVPGHHHSYRIRELSSLLSPRVTRADATAATPSPRPVNPK